MPKPNTAALFITCLADQVRPSVAEATVRLIQRCGFEVEVPLPQSCCGQPAFNSGDDRTARALAEQTIALLESFELVVLPSGSCTGMLRHHYPELLAAEPELRARAEALAQKTHELSEFLARYGQALLVEAQAGAVARLAADGSVPAPVAYHASCASRRELQSPNLAVECLNQTGVMASHPDDAEVCCGFGGLFCVKYSAISEAMGAQKLQALAGQSAQTVCSGDLGCLLHLERQSKRLNPNQAPQFFHLAELLDQQLSSQESTPA